jgi:quinol-cytochrome oxidoreductase complex cytochrome b subunit
MSPLDRRLGVSDSIRRSLLDRPVPLHALRFWYCFGGLTLLTFIIQVLTGIVLTLYYVPTPEKAYASVFYLSHYVSYGWLVRSIHKWSAQLMVVFVVLHMLRVFWTASYKHPREFTWVAGMILLLTTLAFGLTGYLLPWDQKAYWGSTVTASLIGQVPGVGTSLAHVILGGDTIGAPTLTRFFSAHIMILPGILVGFAVAHLWMVRKLGISGPL